MEYSHLGSNFRFFRQLLGLSQADAAQLATAAGAFLVTQNDISRIELGLRPPDAAFVATLARALHLTTDDLLRRPRVVHSLVGVRPLVVVRQPATGEAQARV